MKEITATDNRLNGITGDSPEGGKKNSIFQLLIVAFQRHKQLNDGAVPRVILPSLKSKKTRIAIEEVRQGLILYHPAK